MSDNVEVSSSRGNSPILPSKVYDKLKWIALILLPALGSAYAGFAELWALPYPHEVVGSVAVIDTFLGVVLGLSTRTYNKSGQDTDGDMLVDNATEGPATYRLALNATPEELADKSKISFNVIKSQ